MYRSRRVGCSSPSKGWRAEQERRGPRGRAGRPRRRARDCARRARRRGGARPRAGPRAPPRGTRPRTSGGRASTAEQHGRVALAATHPGGAVRESRRPPGVTPDPGERRPGQELLQPDGTCRRGRRQPHQEARRQTRTARGRVRARREQEQTVSRRLAGEGEQERRLGVALLCERQAHAERLRDAAPGRVAEDGVGASADGKAALGEPGERDGGEAQAAQLKGREHRHAVAADPPVRYAGAGEDLAQRLQRLLHGHLAAEHGEWRQAAGGVPGGGSGVVGEDRLDDGRQRRRPRPPGGALGKACGGSRERARAVLEPPRRPQAGAQALQSLSALVVPRRPGRPGRSRALPHAVPASACVCRRARSTDPVH